MDHRMESGRGGIILFIKAACRKWQSLSWASRVSQLKLSLQGLGHYWGQPSSCFHIFFIGKWGSTWAPLYIDFSE